ncbi:MAG: hypothetical protein ACRDJJ_07715 [Actinomycetota bacterium]
MRKITVLLLCGILFGLLASPVDAGKPKPLWEDEAGDAGLDPTGPLPGMDQGGVDLVEGYIVRKGKNIEFTAVHAAMPPFGSLPEAVRFLWSFSVGKEQYRLTVKSVDVGKPDVAQGQTTERVGRVDLQGHFRLEGECGSQSAGLTFINCKPLAYLKGAFDPAKASFTVIVPMKAIRAKPGSVIGPGAGDSSAICNVQICWVSHYAERSLSPSTLIDTAVVAKSYKVPK